MNIHFPAGQLVHQDHGNLTQVTQTIDKPDFFVSPEFRDITKNHIINPGMKASSNYTLVNQHNYGKSSHFIAG
jgi:hypothetical protein